MIESPIGMMRNGGTAVGVGGTGVGVGGGGASQAAMINRAETNRTRDWEFGPFMVTPPLKIAARHLPEQTRLRWERSLRSEKTMTTQKWLYNLKTIPPGHPL